MASPSPYCRRRRNSSPPLKFSSPRNDYYVAMYATIEPRLIALLNDASSEAFVAYSRLDLPPLDHNILKASGRPSPLEPNTGSRSDKSTSISVSQNISFDREAGDSIATRITDAEKSPQNSSGTDRALGDTSPQSLQKILDDPSGVSQSQLSKKRQRTDSSKDEFVQLPQPPKKQKAAKQVVPPIIIGLFEPPPNAALFPPIASSSFHDSHGRNSLNIGPPNEPKSSVPLEIQAKNVDKVDTERKEGQKTTTRIRKKWTEEETTQLLLGVQAHGVGSWTKILQDPDFKFDGRRAVDLKDRFRTCCPTELRGRSKRICTTPREVKDEGFSGIPKRKSSLATKNILIDSDGSSTDEKAPSPSRKGSRKCRAHRKKLEDLAELGIKEPFKRSQRRERRPFSDKEDRQILQGFQEYGPAWTRILKDPRFDLESRRPTDLRDRLRNKYPEKYFFDEEARYAVKESSDFTGQTGNLPSSSQASVPSAVLHESLAVPKIPAQQPTSSILFKDNFLELLEPPPVSDAPDSLSFDWGDNITAFHTSMGEMDISRILLDDTWNPRKTS